MIWSYVFLQLQLSLFFLVSVDKFVNKPSIRNFLSEHFLGVYRKTEEGLPSPESQRDHTGILINQL